MKTGNDAKILFNVTYSSKIYPGRTELMTQVALDSLKKYAEWYTIDSVVQCGKIWPRDAVVETTNTLESPCYKKVLYKVTVSGGPLEDEDFAILRAQGCFISGQEFGEIISYVKLDEDSYFEKYVYTVRSICDSSD